jgi:peptidoglycan hydrolase-like protein with peptidoglycan-binding domain
MKKTIAVIALMAAPALASAQAGLSKIAFLALQQELRDQGCGVTNVDGSYGPQTRRAIAACAKKFGTPNNAAALLTAMNIGFGPNDNPPAGGGGGGAASAGGGMTSQAKAEGETTKTEKKEHVTATKKTARRRAAKKAAAADTTKK